MRRSFACLVFLAACDSSAPAKPTDTSGVAPSSIVTAVTVRSNGAAILVEASISGDAVKLGSGDALLAGAPDVAERPLGEYQPSKGAWAYALFLPTAEASVTLGFARAAAAARQTFALPEPFVVTAPATASRAQPLALSWNPGKNGETFTLEARGPCLGGAVTRTPDPTGTAFELQPADFQKYSGVCTVEVKLSRRRGTIGSFAGLAATSQVTLEQLRTVTIETTP